MRPRHHADSPLQNSALSTTVFALGLVLTSATQLRFAPVGVGIGEVILLVWSLGSGLLTVHTRHIVASSALKIFTAFWALAFFLLLTSLLVSDANSLDVNRVEILHDLMAFAFVALILLCFVAPPALGERVGRTAAAFLNLSVLSLLLLFLVSLRVPVIGPMHIWYWDRFTAWAENPNQLALLLSGAPFVGGYLAMTRQGGARVWYCLLTVVAIGIGIATRSDALTVGWGMSSAFVLSIGWWRRVRGGARYTLGAGLLYVTGPLLAAAIALSAGGAIEEHIASAGRSVYAENRQGSVRVYLWEQGLDAFANGPLIGRGAGPHSQTATTKTMEAHNTLIDWATAVGIFGLMAYLCLLVWALTYAWRSRSVVLTAGWLMIFTFSLFHYVMRQPVYWFYLLAVVVFAAGRIGFSADLVPAPRTRFNVREGSRVRGERTPIASASHV